MTMNDKQKTMMDRAKASTATMGVGMMAAPRPPMVEYALTKDAGPNIGGPATTQEAARITIKLSDKTELAIVRTSVDIRSDMCVWRGAVEGTGAPATIMWWPGGKMAGTVQHEGKHLFDPPHGRRDARRGRDGRGPHAAGACADARAHARQ